MYDKQKRVWFDADAHQAVAYDHLCANRRAALFLGMSLSKTVIALTYLYDMHYREVAFLRTLVIAPDKVARITWPDEIERWAHLEGMRYSLIAGTAEQRLNALKSDAEIYIVSVENVSWLVHALLDEKKSISGYGNGFFDSLVIDEIDLFKNRGGQRFKNLRKFIRGIEYRIGMTGTPQPNHLTDLWAEMLLLDDGERLGARWGAFVDKYFTMHGKGMIVYEYRPKAGAAETIAHKISDIALTMKTRDAIKLPELITENVYIGLIGPDREAYDALEQEWTLDLLGGGEVTVKTAADLTNKLLQVSSGAIYEDGTRVWRLLNSAKMDALRALLAQHPDENFILVYRFRHEAERVKGAFPFARELRRGVHTAQDFRDWNDGKIRLLILHPASAGHGLNLQFGGRRMIWFSLTWNLGHYQQTVARLLRRGLLSEVYVYRLMITGTRDSRVCRCLENKESSQEFLMNEVKELRWKLTMRKRRHS
jgi:hypothetical protein